MVESRNQQIKDLQESSVKLMDQNAKLSVQVSELQEENEKLNTRIAELESALAEYESGNVYEGTVIGEGTHHTVITGMTLNGKKYTEEQMADKLKSFQIDVQE